MTRTSSGIRVGASPYRGACPFCPLPGADLGDGVAAVERVVADLQRTLAGPFVVDGAEQRTQVSIGTALYPRDGATVRELLAAADADMYRHKPRGRARPG